MNAPILDKGYACWLLLFFHPTVIQHIYDTHFEGAEQAEALIRKCDAMGVEMKAADGYRQPFSIKEVIVA